MNKYANSIFKAIELPSFARSAIKYTIANLLNAIVPILLLPLLTMYLTKSDYGLVSIFQVGIMLAIPLVGFNAQGALEREFFNKRFRFEDYLSSALFVLLVSGFLITLVTLLLGSYISDFIDFPSAWLWTIPGYCIFHNTGELLLSTWRVADNASAYGVFRVSRTILEIALSICCVVLFSLGWEGRVMSILMAAGVFFILTMFFLRKKGVKFFYYDVNQLKDILKFGAPLILHSLGGVIMIYSDRIFITKMVGLEATGSYTVGYQVAMAISLLQSSFNLAWVPWFYSRLNLNAHNAKLQIVKITYGYYVVIIVCALLLSAISPILFKLFINESYNDSIQFVFWIALAFAFDGMYKMAVNYIFYLKKTYIISIVTFFTASLNLILNYFFIQQYGAIGAAKATTVAMFVQFVLIWLVSNKIYPMPWLLGKESSATS